MVRAKLRDLVRMGGGVLHLHNSVSSKAFPSKSIETNFLSFFQIDTVSKRLDTNTLIFKMFSCSHDFVYIYSSFQHVPFCRITENTRQRVCHKIYLKLGKLIQKRSKKKLDENYTTMLRAVLDKSWKQHRTKLQLYNHLPSISQIIQVRRTRQAGRTYI